MTAPEDALARAREAAERRREAGEDPAAGLERTASSIATDEPGLDELSEWALIAVPDESIYSTRRGGGAIVAVKRLLLRLLRQYNTELEGQQTRFNSALLEHVRELEERVARLERE